MDYKKTRAIVIERPYFANLREIELTQPKDDAFITKTLFSSISTGTDCIIRIIRSYLLIKQQQDQH